jgi:hypothetical protein
MHVRCSGEKDCALYAALQRTPRDLLYHMSTDHCKVCSCEWKRRRELACRPPDKALASRQ